jgi:hypothetical protein
MVHKGFVSLADFVAFLFSSGKKRVHGFVLAAAI